MSQCLKHDLVAEEADHCTAVFSTTPFASFFVGRQDGDVLSLWSDASAFFSWMVRLEGGGFTLVSAAIILALVVLPLFPSVCYS